MRNTGRWDVLKILVFFAAAMVLGAALAPWLYNAGKALAEITANRETGDVVRWLADACRRSEFPRFFNRALLLCALLLLVPLVHWLRIGRAPGSFRDAPWSFRLPHQTVRADIGQPLRRNPRGMLECSIGFLLATGLLLLIGYVLLATGWFAWRPGGSFGRAALAALPTAVIVGLTEEIVFRGMLLGIFLRAMRPTLAIGCLSLLFAFLHFLKPPPGVAISHPETAGAGFQLLGIILARFGDPTPFLTEFTTLLAVGLVLGHARWRTASLWLPVGLHTGWVFGVFVFKAVAIPAGPVGYPGQLFIGGTLREGLIPTALVIATGLLVHVLTSRAPHERDLQI